MDQTHVQSGLSVENARFKFVELRKCAFDFGQKKEWKGLINGLASSFAQRLLFVALGDSIVAVRVDALLDFTWSKRVVNEIVNDLPSVRIQLDYSLILLSVSGGENDVLAVVGKDVDTFVVEFYDVLDLNDSRPIEAFCRLEMSQNDGYITDMSWHPEYSSSLLATTTSTGLIVTFGLDRSKKIAERLCQMNEMATSVCWSPKGKQLVVGKLDGSFTQYKHENGLRLTRAKTVQKPVGITSDLRVVKIRWIHSSLFAIVYADGFSMNSLVMCGLVSVLPKTPVKFLNFGKLWLDLTTACDGLSVELATLANICIVCSSTSSEVHIIGSESEHLTDVTTWSQWMLEDTSRIELPLCRNKAESSARGMTLIRQTDKVINVSETEQYGANSPLLLVLTSDGVICPYCICHRDEKIILPDNISPKQLAVASISPRLQFAKNNNGQNIKPSNKQEGTSLVKGSDQHQTDTTLASRSHGSGKYNSPRVEISSSAVANGGSVVPKKIASSAPVTKEVDTFQAALKEELNEFDKEIKLMKKRLAEIKTLTIGTKEEKATLRKKSSELNDILVAFQEALTGMTENMDTLKGYLLESFSMAEDAKSRVERNQDPRYLHLLKKRSLDPITGRKYKEIKNHCQYIEQQIRETDNVLDQEWEENLEAKKNRLQNKPNDSSVELIYKILANNQKLLTTLNQKIHHLCPAIDQTSNKQHQSIDANDEKIIRLTASLKQSKLDDALNCTPMPSFKLPKSLSNEQQAALREFLEKRTTVPLRKCKTTATTLNKLRASEQSSTRSTMAFSEMFLDKVRSGHRDGYTVDKKLDENENTQSYIVLDTSEKDGNSNHYNYNESPNKGDLCREDTYEDVKLLDDNDSSSGNDATENDNQSNSDIIVNQFESEGSKCDESELRDQQRKDVWNYLHQQDNTVQTDTEPKTDTEPESEEEDDQVNEVEEVEKQQMISYPAKFSACDNMTKVESQPTQLPENVDRVTDNMAKVQAPEENEKQLRSPPQPAADSRVPSAGPPGLFSMPFTAGSSVGQAGFGSQVSHPIATFSTGSVFGAASSFSSPLGHGGQAFGAPPIFGGSPTGNLVQTNSNQSTGFGSFGSSSNIPSFGSVAAATSPFTGIQQQQQPTSAFASTASMSFSSLSNSGGDASFQQSSQFSSASFQQRRQ